ncbi:MAG TPA: 30S ribosomal protein S12 methylthiotransferase RimO [Acidobacteriota bacterium]|nr:30S ribosomal protein S12 methylthiotransferase RimO [Acidobacteriota bacterium]
MTKQKKVGFISLGCPKNLVDSEVMMGLLAQQGHILTQEADEADVLVVNTCGFIEAAKQESINTILEMATLKEQAQGRKLIVTGCLVERYRNDLLQEIPEIDGFLGTNELEGITSLVHGLNDQVVRNPVQLQSKRRLPVLATPPAKLDPVPAREAGLEAAAYLYSDQTPRLRTTPRHYAYLKIAEGCDHPCAFCSIPQMRGNLRSRRAGSILQEAERLAAEGVKELILIGQDTTSYGEDLGVKDGLANLLKELAKIEGLQWIRFLYSYPTRLSNAVLDVMAAEPRLCKYVDIPLQHASTRMLHAMRRPGSREFLEKMVRRIRAHVPDIALRTTFIVGYPGETEADFEELVSFCKEQEFDRVGVFTYSDEDSTPAFHLADKVPARTAESRRKKLMKVQEQISKRRNKRFLGKTVDVVFEGLSEESDLIWQGRMATQAPDIDGHVLITDTPEGFKPEIGQLVRVEIMETHAHDLVGHIVAAG